MKTPALESLCKKIKQKRESQNVITLCALRYQPPTLLFSQAPSLKSANCPSTPFLGNSPNILVFRDTPPPTKKKIEFFS